MMRCFIFVACCTLVAAFPALGSAAPAPSAKVGAGCPHLGGYIDGPFVPTVEAAREVYIAVRNAIAPDYRLVKHASVIAEDKGGHWEVTQRIHVRNARGQLVSIMGGGGLWLDIDKCSGAVLHAAYNR